MAHSLEVVFHGATLLVVEHSKQPYVPMKPVVSGMGLDWAAQFTKLKTNTARWGIAEIAIPTASGEQGMSCLPLRKLPGWLATISPNKVRPELREKVIAYQNEADDVLWAAWQDQQPKAEPQQMRLDYDRISPAQAQDLKEIVDAIVKAGVQTYGETWKRLQHKFRVNSYLELPATLHLDARNYLIAKLPKATPENVVEEAPKAGTVNEMVADWVKKIEAPNGYGFVPFLPLVEVVQRKMGRRMVELPPGHIVVDARKLAAIWNDLGKLRSRIDGLGMLESDLPPSWWAQQAITAA